MTFSQPMIAVASVEEVEEQGTAGVQIRPQPAGRFRWVGTKTLLFEPEHRFPMSTLYKVTVSTTNSCLFFVELGDDYINNNYNNFGDDDDEC